jgi:hypothetical protein
MAAGTLVQEWLHSILALDLPRRAQQPELGWLALKMWLQLQRWQMVRLRLRIKQ